MSAPALAVACCHCSAVAHVACELSGIPAAMDALGAQGWCHDARGFAVCPACAKLRAARAAPPAQANLLGDAA